MRFCPRLTARLSRCLNIRRATLCREDIRYEKARMNKTMTVGRYLVTRLEQMGLRHIFGVPGDYRPEVLRRDRRER